MLLSFDGEFTEQERTDVKNLFDEAEQAFFDIYARQTSFDWQIIRTNGYVYAQKSTWDKPGARSKDIADIIKKLRKKLSWIDRVKETTQITQS